MFGADDPPSTGRPSPATPPIARPLTVVFDALRTSPEAVAPARLPTRTIRGAAPVPGWVVPSRAVGCVSAGKADSGAIVRVPVPMAKMIRLGAAAVAAAASLARIAWRRLPAPASLVLVTVKLASSCRVSRGSTSGRRADRRARGVGWAARAGQRRGNQRGGMRRVLRRGGPRPGGRGDTARLPPHADGPASSMRDHPSGHTRHDGLSVYPGDCQTVQGSATEAILFRCSFQGDHMRADA